MSHLESQRDLFIPDKSSLRRATISPRVILLTPELQYPVVKHNSGWYGLPGGKIQIGEAHGNFLSTGAFATLEREVEEECGIDVRPFLFDKSGCLGYVEIQIVDEEQHRITTVINPIFICTVPSLEGISPASTIYNIWESPGPLFPDARIGVKHVQRSIREEKKGPIVPEFLQHEQIFFTMKPRPSLLNGPPSWA